MSKGDLTYFKLIADYFWQWEDNGEVIAIPNSGTLAYRETIEKILSALAPQGFPLFGTLLLAVAYTSVTKFEKHKTIENILLRSRLEKKDNSNIKDALHFLSILKSLGSEYHKGEKRLLLLVTIFKECHNRISIKKSNQILNLFKSKKPLNLSLQLKSPAFSQVYYDTRPLALLYKKYPTAESIKNAMAGIDDTQFEDIDIEEIDILEDLGDDLVSQIIRNKDTSKSGALIKRIWSSANIPMHNKLPSGQPFGGVADITNKGEFDKLLISEFANEDVAFLSRLANREAMYFNREAPPSDNKEDRILILDVSLKNWGTPKTIAFALMLAIAHHPNSKKNNVCYAVGRRAYNLGIDDIDEIVESAQVLDTSLTAARGLKELFSENDFSQNEVFFISERSSSEVLDVAHVLSEYNHPIDYWIYPNKNGEVDIFKKYRSGSRHHQSFKLPLNDLWNKKRKKVTTKKKEEVRTTDFPINMLVPTPQNIEHFIFWGEDLFIITSDRVLLKKEYSEDGRSPKGWRLLHMDVPYIDCYHSIGRNEKGEFVLLSCFRNENRLHLLNVELNISREVDFSHHHSTRFKNFIYKDFSFYLIRDGYYFKINMKGSIEKKKDVDRLIEKLVYKDIGKQKNVMKFIGKMEPALKHIHTVSIMKGHLEINNHKLSLNDQGDLKLWERTMEFSVDKIHSKRDAENVFRFPNGNSVRILKFGILVLTNESNAVGEIYITSLIGKPLSAYVRETFAGNKAYFLERKYLLRREEIYKIGEQKTDMFHSTFKFIESDIEISETEKYTYSKIRAYGGQKKIHMKDFYKKHIYKFIKEIEDYDSRN